MIRFYLFFMLFLIKITPSCAFSIKPWFENMNQHATRLMAEKKYAEAEKTFTRPDWQAVAAYRGTNYEQASKQFKALQNQLGFYNQGNALAHLGQYQEAIKAYEQTLKINPNHEDAKHNRDLLKKLLEENKQEQNKQDQEQKQQDQEQNKQDQEQKQQDQEQKQQDQAQKQQDQEQALRIVPDDPGGLLREKFWRDHWRRLKTGRP